MSCKGQLPPSSQTGQSCGWLVIKNSTTDARKSLASSSAIEMNVPFDAGVMHDMTMRPVLSLSSRYDLTAHWRHAPTLPSAGRSEEHTSELQSLMRISYAVFCLKKTNTKAPHTPKTN